VTRPFRPFWFAVTFAVMASLTPVSAEPSASPKCSAPKDLARLDRVLERTTRRLAAGDPVTIVAFGSSSTAGAGASSPDNTYPSRLAVELRQLFPGHPITVINRGVNGEEVADMLARIDQTVLVEKPDVVIWQVGTNAVLRDYELQPAAAAIRAGLARFKEIGADVVLMDPQFAPKVIAKPEIGDMLRLIATVAKQDNVDLFHRFAVMQTWRDASAIPSETFISPDELHMNDWGYGCLAKILAGAIADAATRPVLTAKVSTVH